MSQGALGVRALVPWASWFTRLAQRMVSARSSEQRLQILQRLEPSLAASAFRYPDAITQRIGMRSLLLVLSHLICHLDRFPQDALNLVYQSLLHLVGRTEFQISADVAEEAEISTGEDKEMMSEIRGILQDYTAQLMTLSIHVLQVLHALFRLSEQEQSREAAANVRVGFAIKVLPMIYFKMPAIRKFVLDSLCGSGISFSNRNCEEKKHDCDSDDCTFREKKLENPGIDDAFRRIRLDKLEVKLKELISSQEKNVLTPDAVKFTQENPNLFMWRLFVSPDDDEISSSLDAISGDSFVSVVQDEVYFEIVSGILQHALESSKRPVQWNVLPGYWRLVKNVFLRIRYVNPLHYSYQIRGCCLILALNPVLMPILSEVCLYNTNALDRRAVDCCMNLLENYFDGISQEGKPECPLPQNFCFDVFLEAVKVLLSSDDFQILCKTLCFLYSQSSRFYGKHRQALFLEHILGENFNRLFSHWSYLVRKYYHALVVYKIQRRGLIFSFDQAVNHAQEVKERKLLLSNESSSSITEQVVSLVSSVGNSLLGWMYSSSEKTSTELDASTLSEECENWSSNRLEYLEKFLVVSHELTIEEIETDEMIESSLITCIAMAEATNQNLYSSVGLDEFEILKARAISFQKSIGVPLRIFEVACPDMFFEIADSNEVFVETSIEMDFSMDSCLQGNPPSVKF